MARRRSRSRSSEPVWSPDGSRFAALVADPSVTDPELEPVKPGMYTTAQPFMDLYVVEADGSSKNITSAFDDQVSDPVWSPDGGALFFRAVNNKTYDETVYRYSVAEQKLEPVVRGQESYGRFVAAPRRYRVGGRGRNAPDSTSGCSARTVSAPGSPS